MNRIKDTLKHAVGQVAELAFPYLGKDIDNARNTTRAPRLKRAIIHARLQRAKASGDHDAVEKALSTFWKGNPGDAFFSRHSDARFQLFLDHHLVIIEALRDFLESDRSGFHRIVEIGCGEGRALAHCFGQMPHITSAVGLDINATVINQASAEHADNKELSFIEADGTDWLTANPSPGTVLFVNGGVLEYFSPEKLEKLLNTLAAHPSAAIVLIEPAAPGHDLENNNDSIVFGYENSFSHNHRYRLTQAGFEILHTTELQIGQVRWILMLGVCPGPSSR
ncbi:class I SAM-dependent methyltransferase [Sneathiella sp.]|uniref:class I SAM-dependent methyltransferase n=1 Tax=Sneathiella sp. TaxID=1964365 RepID=UPI003565A40C